MKLNWIYKEIKDTFYLHRKTQEPTLFRNLIYAITCGNVKVYMVRNAAADIDKCDNVYNDDGSPRICNAVRNIEQ